MRTLTRTRLGRSLAGLIVLLLAILVFAPLITANAQQANKMYRIGVLSEGLAPTAGATGGPRPLFGEETWRTAFRHRGYVEGQNALFEFRHAGERFERNSQRTWSEPRLTSSSRSPRQRPSRRSA